jgi:hypothetical protein
MGSNHTLSCPKKSCTPVSSVMTFVNELILSLHNSVNLMFVKYWITAQMDAFLNSWITVNRSKTGTLITYYFVAVNTHEREWKDMSSYGVYSFIS